MQCPYCKGDIPDDAVKCMHCGEWVKQKPAAAEPESDVPVARSASEMLGRVWHGGLTTGDVAEGVRWYVKYRIVMAIVGAIVFLIFLFAVFLPQWNKANEPLYPAGPPVGISCPAGQTPGIDASGVPYCR